MVMNRRQQSPIHHVMTFNSSGDHINLRHPSLLSVTRCFPASEALPYVDRSDTKTPMVVNVGHINALESISKSFEIIAGNLNGDITMPSALTPWYGITTHFETD